MNFQTRYNRKKTPPEKNSGEILVETAGYISARQQIEALMNAGLRLSVARKELYDFPDGEIINEVTDPTRVANYDMADAFQDGLIVEESLKASQTAQDEQNKVLELEKAKALVEAENARIEALKASEGSSGGGPD